MSVIFRAEHHKYESLDPNDWIEWTSVTKFVSKFKQPFDAEKQAIKSSKNPRSKWYKMDPADIIKHWHSTTDDAIKRGSSYHDQRESDLTSIETIQRSGVAIPIIKPIWEGGVKHAPDQKLTEGIYPEHFMYLKSAGICGQSDRVEVVKDTVDIVDYKTNKEIKKTGFTNWEGKVTKMLGACEHLDDCNFNHYALQLSTYMYMILKHNPRYKAGKLWIHHIIFKKIGEDEFGNPQYQLDDKGEPIVDKVVPYEVPYLKSEVIAMINHLKENKV